MWVVADALAFLLLFEPSSLSCLRFLLAWRGAFTASSAEEFDSESEYSTSGIKLDWLRGREALSISRKSRFWMRRLFSRGLSVFVPTRDHLFMSF